MREEIGQSGTGAHVPLVAAASLVLRVLAALDDGEVPAALVAAHAGLRTAVARRHLNHLARIGLVRAATADRDGYRVAPGPGVPRPASLTAEGSARAAAWRLGCAFEAARVLGAAALPGGEQILRDPDRPPLIPRDRAAALAWFVRERSLLGGALESARECGAEDRAWRLGLLILNISCFAGVWDGWRRVYELSLGAARAERHRAAEAMIEEFAGKLELASGSPGAARAHHQASLEIRTAEGDAAAVARSLNVLGVAYLREEKLPEAEALFAQALELALKAGDEEVAEFARMNSAAVDARSGRGPEAIRLLTTVAAALRAAGREVYAANAIEDIAVAHRAHGDLAQALQAALDAEAAAVEAGVPMFLAGPLIEQARIHSAQGDRLLALALLHEAHGIFEELGDPLRAGRVGAEIERITAQRGTG